MPGSTSDIEFRIAKWLQSLKDVTVPGSDPVTAERIATTAAMLAKDGFPGAAFTSDSLHHVAQGTRFFPAYDDIRKALHAWWDAHRPASAPQITGPVQGLDAMDRAWIAFWHKRRAEIFGADNGREAAEAALEIVSSLVRSKSEKAWLTISGERPAAVRSQPAEAEVSYVARLLRPEPLPGQPRYEVVEGPVPLPDVTIKGAELDRVRRIRGGMPERQGAVVTDRGEWA